MTLEDSDRLIGGTPVGTVGLCYILGKNQKRYQEENYAPPRVWFIFGSISRCLKVPKSSVQTTIAKYKHNGNVQSSLRSGRRLYLGPRDECVLVQSVCTNPRTKAKHFVKMVAERYDPSSLSPYQDSELWKQTCMKVVEVERRDTYICRGCLS